MGSHTKIELLAPARDLTAGIAAVDCGADAVYIGAPSFGARRAAGNPIADIARLVHYAHLFGVRVYATLNTILLDEELGRAEGTARKLLEAGVDALIVQDMSWLRMGLGRVEFHASTQTSVIRPEDAAFLGRAGFRRLILERNLSLDGIKAIRAATDAELEVFIHGAICVCYSGRCFMSRSTGPRSGNRGECSQPCRLSYDLTDGAGNAVIKGKHLLSVRDLDLSGHIPELLDAGVTSFKIEGRLKDTSYIRNTVSHYRGLIDKALAVRPHLQRASAGASEPDFTPDPSKSFTRGATDYFFNGQVRGVASFDTPKSVGAPVGKVDAAGAGWFTLKGTKETLAPGDGICFLAGSELLGTNINRVDGGRVFSNKMEGIAPGTEVYRNYDHVFTRALDRSRTRRRIAVQADASMEPGRLTVVFTDETGLSASVSREEAFDRAKDPEKMSALLRAQLSKSGDTIFDVTDVAVAGEVLFAPVSMLAEVRREGLQRLLEMREELIPERHPVKEYKSVKFPRARIAASENVTNRLAELFYRDHGVKEIEPGLDLRPSMDGEAVMRTRYCIRREIGECLLEKPKLKGDLWLTRGGVRYRLDFDCAACEMAVTTAADFSASSLRTECNEVKQSSSVQKFEVWKALNCCSRNWLITN